MLLILSYRTACAFSAPGRLIGAVRLARLLREYVAWIVKAMGLFGSKHKESVDGNKDKDLVKPKIPRTAVVSFVYKVAR